MSIPIILSILLKVIASVIRKEKLVIHTRMEEITSEVVITYVENPKGSIKRLLQLISLARSDVFLCTSDEQLKNKFLKYHFSITLTTTKGNAGINLTKYVENWLTANYN